jgi:phage shock protein PspC (stress-responsive transcriptional regulator)
MGYSSSPELGMLAAFLSLVVIAGAIVWGTWLSPRQGLAADLRSLARSRQDARVGGVCAGLGKNTAFPTWMWRFLFLSLLFFLGGGLLIYIILWIALPEEPGSA